MFLASVLPAPDPLAVEDWLRRVYLAPGKGLRLEERKKAIELGALLAEIARAAGKGPKEMLLVDAAAGKAYAGLAAADLVLARAGRKARVVVIERDTARTGAVEEAARRVESPGVTVEVCCGRAGDRSLWPEAPDVVVALHACGAAFDEAAEAAVSVAARRLLLVPCCTGGGLPAEREALAAGERLGLPAHGLVRRAFVESWVAATRTLSLEAAGYETEVMAFVAPTVTPYHLLWRARRVREPVRMAAARERLARMRGTA